jgi:hypothetical protein
MRYSVEASWVVTLALRLNGFAEDVSSCRTFDDEVCPQHWVLSKTILSIIPLRHYSLESLTVHKAPGLFFFSPEVPPLI